MTSSPNTELPPKILVSTQYFPATVVKGGLHNNSPMRDLRTPVYIYVSTYNYTVMTKQHECLYVGSIATHNSRTVIHLQLTLNYEEQMLNKI